MGSLANFVLALKCVRSATCGTAVSPIHNEERGGGIKMKKWEMKIDLGALLNDVEKGGGRKRPLFG